MAGGNIRLPDISIYLWSGMPNRERYPGAIYPVAPDLAVEVLSPSNTIKEMDNKRAEYFASGCSLFWIVDPDDRTVTVYTSLTTSTRLTVVDLLTGGTVLPGYTVHVKHLFSEMDRRG